MNSIKEKLKQEFLADVVLSETPKTISIITSQNAANLIDFLSKKNIDQINIYPDINNELSLQSDLYTHPLLKIIIELGVSIPQDNDMLVIFHLCWISTVCIIAIPHL